VVLGQEVDSLKTYARLARLRFEGGYTSYIEVLDAERSLFNAQLSYTQTNGVVYESVVALYKAMGGGWVVTAEQMTHKDTDTPPPAGQPGEQHGRIPPNAEQSVAELPR
jgi:multidrug efflux system outer membrane protein